MALSLQARFWRSILRKAFKRQGLSIKAERIRSLKNSRVHLPFPRDVPVTTIDVDGLPSVSIRPAFLDGERIVLHLHGGGYVSGSIVAYLMLCIPMARALNATLILPEYRLAPEDPYPAALEDALKAYRWLLAQGHAPSDIVLSGDSAGGGLCLAAAQALRDAGDPLPSAIICLSPWTDLTHSAESHAANVEADVLLKTDMLKLWASYYAGGMDLRHPLVSPAFADFAGFPPMLIQVGSDEILLDDSRVIAERAKAAGVDVELRVWDELWHVWQILGDLIPESRLAFAEMRRFLDARKAPAAKGA